jgi:hypothetical protein
VQYEDTASEVEAIVPPFIYNYECGSTIMQTYIPVYVYVYIYQCLVGCCLLLVLSSIDYEVLPAWLQRRVYGLVWPDIWSGDAPAAAPAPAANDRTQEKRTGADSDTFRIPTTKKLSKFKSIASSDIFRHVVVLLTFGVCSPLLACLIALSVTIKLHMWIAMLGRFVHYRVVTKCRYQSKEVMNESRSESETLSELLYLHPPVLPGDLSGEEQAHMTSHSRSRPADYTLQCIARGLLPLQDVFEQCGQPVLWSSALFMGCITWDLSSDGDGWRGGYWAPIACGAVASLLWVYSRVSLHVTGGRSLSLLLLLRPSPPPPLVTTDTAPPQGESGDVRRVEEEGGGGAEGDRVAGTRTFTSDSSPALSRSTGTIIELSENLTRNPLVPVHVYDDSIP